MEEKLIRVLEKKVQTGDVTSMRTLAEMYYEFGNGKKPSVRKIMHKKAQYYYELASEKGDIFSRLNLANMILLDFYIFVGMNRSETVSDMFFKLSGAPKKIKKGLNLMFSIIDNENINPDLFLRSDITAIIEKTAFVVYFISNDFLYIREFLDRGKFLDSIKNQIVEYRKKCEKIIEKYNNTPYYEKMSQTYYKNIVFK